MSGDTVRGALMLTDPLFWWNLGGAVLILSLPVPLILWVARERGNR